MPILTTDQKAHLRTIGMNVWEVQFIKEMRNRGGEFDRFDFRKVAPQLKLAILAIVSKGVIEKLSIDALTPDVVRLRLTDQGRAVIEAFDRITIGAT